MEYPQINLEAARVNAKLTQKAAARLLNINPSTLGKYERGKAVPKWDMVRKMAELYQLPSDYIFFGERLA